MDEFHLAAGSQSPCHDLPGHLNGTEPLFKFFYFPTKSNCLKKAYCLLLINMYCTNICIQDSLEWIILVE